MLILRLHIIKYINFSEWQHPHPSAAKSAAINNMSVLRRNENRIMSVFYFLLSRAIERNIINNISDTGRSLSFLFAFLIDLSS